ncbi:SAM-dependent methyltransferase [Streptomyces sp. P6-2-1]|uniref:SAM-dependent methyltransferase n=1 Tax=unclassified Streptomyces TaxID=2593676 RepID=UPI003D3642E6
MTAPAASRLPEVAETNQHYDQDPAVFEQFLDPRMKYTCGLYESDTDDLATAQETKLRWIADTLGLRPGARLLDIGCGWGSLSLYAAAERGCRVTAVSPAPHQRGYIMDRATRQGVADRVEVVTERVERLTVPDRAHDAVALVGSSAHMKDIGQVMRLCWSALRRGGYLYLSDSCYRNTARHTEFAEREGSVFVRDSIFGGGEMRPLSVLVAAAEDAGFSVEGVRDLTEDYALTIDAWMRNVEDRADRLDAIEPGLSAKLLRYFEIANAGWGFTTKHYALICRKAR